MGFIALYPAVPGFGYISSLSRWSLCFMLLRFLAFFPVSLFFFSVPFPDPFVGYSQPPYFLERLLAAGCFLPRFIFHWLSCFPLAYAARPRLSGDGGSLFFGSYGLPTFLAVWWWVRGLFPFGSSPLSVHARPLCIHLASCFWFLCSVSPFAWSPRSGGYLPSPCFAVLCFPRSYLTLLTLPSTFSLAYSVGCLPAARLSPTRRRRPRGFLQGSLASAPLAISPLSFLRVVFPLLPKLLLPRRMCPPFYGPPPGFSRL